jgi:hypothetical protein
MTGQSIALFGPDMPADPYPTYRHLRETAPVCRRPDLACWLCTP